MQWERLLLAGLRLPVSFAGSTGLVHRGEVCLPRRWVPRSAFFYRNPPARPAITKGLQRSMQRTI